MGSSEQEFLTDYLDAGGALYIEGSSIGSDHIATDFLHYFGAQVYSGGTTDDVAELAGCDGSLAESLRFAYEGGETSHWWIDGLTVFGGMMIFMCEDNRGRVIANTTTHYRTICSSVILGAFVDGGGNNTKAYLMSRYLEFLSG